MVCSLRAPYGRNLNLSLASNDEILIAQPAKKGEAANAIGTYQLEDLRLEYEVIENKTLADEIVELYGGCIVCMYVCISISLKTLALTAGCWFS